VATGFYKLPVAIARLRTAAGVPGLGHGD